MLSFRTRLDPEGYYDRLGLQATANQAAIIAAYRAKARLLHPDVPRTGNEAAFVALKQAYDVLSNHDRRELYDRTAREAVLETIAPEPAVVSRTPDIAPPPPLRQPRFSDLPVGVWVGAAAVLAFCIFEAAAHLLAPAPVARAGIRPNAATVQPLSPDAHRAVLYGPTPLQLAGTPNFYTLPAGTPALLWRRDTERDTLVSFGPLPPFSAVQAVRMSRQNGMLEVLVDDRGNGFISADHLTPGDAVAARAAYCGYNAGPVPADGEVLEHRGHGGAQLVLENRSVQPTVVKLRDDTGAVAAAVFLGPGGRTEVQGLAEGLYRPEFAIGELWSRACNRFAAGMRARRMQAAVSLPNNAPIVVSPDAASPAATDMTDQAFERD